MVVDRLKFPNTPHQENSIKGDSLKLGACLLLLSGFFIVLAALALLTSLAQRSAFVGAGFGVEALGLSLLTHAYKATRREHR
jgi:hypothetical protein